MIKIGEKLKDFPLQLTSNLQAKFSDYEGKWLILYFYPRDATPGCTVEGQNFRDSYAEIKKLNAEVLGISRDSLKAHEKFKCKEEFPFELISDTDEEICNYFDLIKMKNMYGKQVRGIERSTFIFDEKGILRAEWRKVKIEGHVDEIINTLKGLEAK